jgi:hypothetical protein
LAKLLLNRRKLIEIDDDEILRGFAASNFRDVYSDSPEGVQLALFVAFDPPVGLGSIFPGAVEFNKLFDNWTNNKIKYLEGLTDVNKKDPKKEGLVVVVMIFTPQF